MPKIIDVGWEKGYCPNKACQSDEIRHEWTHGRMQKYRCPECGTESTPKLPEPIAQAANLVKHFYPANGFGGWTYELFDGYGHTAVLSRTYPTKAECEAELRKDLARHQKHAVYGDCYGIIWPQRIEVTGTLYTLPPTPSEPPNAQ